MAEVCMMDNDEAVVLDEAHGIKTVKGSTAQAAFNLRGKRRWLFLQALSDLCFYPGVALPSFEKSYWIDSHGTSWGKRIGLESLEPTFWTVNMQHLITVASSSGKPAHFRHPIAVYSKSNESPSSWTFGGWEYPVRNYFNCNSSQPPVLKISGFRNAFQTFREHSAYQLEYFREDGAERTLHLPDLSEVNPKVQKLMEVEGLEDLLKAT